MLKAATYLLSYFLNCNNHRDNYRNNRTVTVIKIIKFLKILIKNKIKAFNN